MEEIRTKMLSDGDAFRMKTTEKTEKDGEHGKRDGFEDETYIIIPTESFEDSMNHPLAAALYLTDAGYFPRARGHYRERSEGADQYILIYCTEGRGTVEIGDKIYSLRASEAICIPRITAHRYYADEADPWSILWFHFKGENVKYYPVDRPRKFTLDAASSGQRMQMLFSLIFRTLEGSYSLGNFIYISQLLSLILSELYFREKPKESSTQDRHVTMAVRFMYENISSAFTLQELSEKTRLSKSYLNAIFKNCTGKTPMEFLAHIKMQEACKLLKNTDMYIYEISSVLGYEDQYYFSRIFRKVVGVSPREYRNGDCIYCG